MLTEFQKRKITLFFHCNDLNDDGFLEMADFEEFARRIYEVLELSPGSPEYEFVHTQVVKNREPLYKDKSRRTLDDSLEAYDHIINDEDLYNEFKTGYVQSMLRLWDRDGDGRLSADEHTKILWCYGVSKEAAQEAFEHLDRDRDGFLTIEEIMKAFDEFFRGDDPDASGNWLFGPY